MSAPTMDPKAVETSGKLAAMLEGSGRPSGNVEPGLYPGLPMDDYLAIDAASSSRLKKMKITPAHCRAEIDHPSKTTDPQTIGSAIHCALLEPDRFHDRYACGEGDNRNLSWWRERKDAESGMWLDETGRILLREKDWSAVAAVIDNATKTRGVRKTLEALEAVELTGVWIDEETDVKCKLRADGIAPSMAACVDVKVTTREEGASLRNFQRYVWQWGSYLQAGHYRSGLSALIPETPWTNHIILAVEATPPYPVVPYRMIDEAVRAGELEREPLLRLYAECVERDHWPAYTDQFIDLGLPAYAWGQHEDDLWDLREATEDTNGGTP